MEINICIPVLNAYKQLAQCIESIENSSVIVDNIYIINNGTEIIHNDKPYIHIHHSPFNLGVAASWNWFLDNVQEYRIICNDDIIFERGSIERMIECYDSNNLVFVNNSNNPQTNAFSCFLLPQNIIDRVGKFDEGISPNYGYFEDNDYYYRMSLQGFYITQCDASVYHAGSSTLRNFSHIQKESHHKRFRTARDNYVKKWGGEPGFEKYTTPYGK